MGSYRTMRLVVLLLLSSAASGLISEDIQDDIVPEIELVDVDLEASFLQATQFVAKKDDNACRKLAEASEEEVKKAIEVAQKAIDDGAHGKTCATVGDVAVNTAQLAADKAKKDEEKAKKKYDDALGTKISWTFKYEQLEPGHCSIFFDSQDYKDAASKVAQTKEAYIKSKGAAEAADEAL